MAVRGDGRPVVGRVASFRPDGDGYDVLRITASSLRFKRDKIIREFCYCLGVCRLHFQVTINYIIFFYSYLRHQKWDWLRAYLLLPSDSLLVLFSFIFFWK